MYILHTFIYIHVHVHTRSRCNVFVCTLYKHVCTMFRHVCTVLPYPVQVGRIPDVQIQVHSFWEDDRGKCNKTGNPSISDFSTILTSYILILADSSHLPSDEAYRRRMSLPCSRFSTPCYECKPNARNFFDKIFIKARLCWGQMCLFCLMISVG